MKTTAGERAFKARPAEVAKRSSRNQARRVMEKKVGAAALKGREVDHIDGNPLNNAESNLRVISKQRNNVGRRGGKAKEA